MANKKEREKEEVIQESIDNKNKIKKRIIKIVVVLALMLLIWFILRVKINDVAQNNIGNSISNIRNYGYASAQGDWIYYIAPNQNASRECLYKVKTNGLEKTKLLESDTDILSLNVYDNYLYYISIKDNVEGSEDEKDNKIYRLNTDGEPVPQVINDNRFNNDCLEIYVIDGSLFFIGEDMNIYKINLSTLETTLVSDNKTGYIGMNYKYILFNKVINEETYECVTYIMGIDGTDARPVVDGQRLYSVAIDGDYVYYTNAEKKLFRVKIDSNKPESITDMTAYNMNLYGGRIYFLNYKDEAAQDYTVCIYKVNAKPGSTPEELLEMNTYSSFLNVAGGRLIFTDGENSKGYIKFVNINNKNDVFNGYELDYESYVPEGESQQSTPSE